MSGVRLEFLDVGSFREGKYILQLNLWDKSRKIKWNFLNIYGSAHDEHKSEFLDELASFCGGCQEPYIAGGDYNIIRSSDEKNKPSPLPRYSKTFNSIIDSYDILDLGMSGGKFTWSNNQSPPTLERLDRILISKSWEDNFPSAMVFKLPREVSDHSPLIFTTFQQQPLNGLSFKFELSWLKDPNFLTLVHDIWAKPCHAYCAFDRIQAKLKRFKQFFKGWGFNRQGEQRKMKAALQKELLSLETMEEVQVLDLTQLHRKMWVQKKSWKFLRKKNFIGFVDLIRIGYSRGITTLIFSIELQMAEKGKTP